MTTHSTSLLGTTLGLGLIGALALTACDTAERATFQDGEVSETESSEKETPTDIRHDDVLMAEVDAPVEFEECLEAEDMDGATVQWLDDVVVEEHVIEGVEDQTIEVDGEEVEVPGAPDIEVPEIVGQAGCIIEYPAPGVACPPSKFPIPIFPVTASPNVHLKKSSCQTVP